MPQQYSPITPTLYNNHNVAVPGGIGIYGRADIGLLNSLAKGLFIETSAKDMDECGLPNAWARPLNFGAVLYRGDADVELRKRIAGEWRGMLALIALRERMNIDVRCFPINMGTSDDRFVNAVKKIRPPDSYSISPNDTTWENVFVFTFSSRGRQYPIGLSSPTTLVCTAAEYVDKIADVPWFRGRILEDPLAYLAEDDRRALEYWLTCLHMNIKRHIKEYDNADDMMGHFLFKALLSFIEDIRKMETASQLDEVQGSAGYSLSEKIYENFRIEGGIYDYLIKPLKVNDAVSVESDVTIFSFRGSSREKLILVESGLSKSWSRSARSIRVIGPYTLEGAGSMLVKDRDNKYGSINLPDGTRIKLTDGIFTQRLALVKQGNAFPGSPQIKVEAEKRDENGYPRYMLDSITPIIPLSNDILDLVTSEEIAKRISFKIHTDDNVEVITVYFKIKLVGGDFTAYKKYKPDNIDKIQSVPVVAMWPDFVDNGGRWKPYYCMYVKNIDEKTFSLEPNMPAQEFRFKDERKHRKASVGKVGKVPYNTEGWIKMTTGCPDLLKVEYDGKPYGTVVLAAPKTVNEQADTKWSVSIDFGTTSTKIGRKEGSKAFAVSFTSLPFSITGSNERLRRLTMPEYFLPEPEADKDSLPSMFQTIYHDFENLPSTSAKPEPLVPFLNGHTYYSTREEFDAVAPGIKSNLKWGNDTVLIQRFLAQVMLQCTAEAVKHGVHSIEWRYSYPKALPYQTKEALKAIFTLISGKITQTTGISSTEGNNILSATEGIAAGLYFQNHCMFGHAAVCVDIGGGTSDITIWEGNQLIYESSFRLAGRNLFLDLLFRNTNVLKSLGCSDDDVAMLEDLVNNKTELEFYAQIDALLKKQTELFASTLPTCNMDNNTEVQELCDHVSIGLAGLFYYIGMTLKYLKTRKKQRDPALFDAELEEPIPNMFFGGNGARLFGWAARGAYTNQHKINKLFKSMLMSGMEIENKDTVLSIAIDLKNLKSEAANGLLYLDESKINSYLKVEEVYEEAVFAGNDFSVNTNVKYEESDLLTAEMLTSGIQISPNLKNIKTFIERYNLEARKLGMKPIDSNNNGLLAKVFSNVKGTLINYKGMEPRDITLEPIYILSLKSLLHELAEQWTKKHAHIG